MSGIIITDKDYLSSNSSYRNSQHILSSFSKLDLKNEILEMEEVYELERKRLLIKYRRMMAQDNYVNGSVMDQFFIITVFHYFEGGIEINLYKDMIEKFKNYYKLNHTDLYKGNGYVKFDINSTNIVDVIGQYIILPNNIKRNILCPIHRDNSPSFKIYTKNNSRYCFGCKKGGNAANFIADIENISVKEAFKKLINLYK